MNLQKFVKASPISDMAKMPKRLSWEATLIGSLQTRGFQTGYCNIEKSAIYFIWKQGVYSLLKSNRNEKEGTVLKV